MNHCEIKGICEYCGFAYKGTVTFKYDLFPDIKCPNCQELTFNLGESDEVDKLNESEGYVPDYTESKFEVVREYASTRCEHIDPADDVTVLGTPAQ